MSLIDDVFERLHELINEKVQADVVASLVTIVNLQVASESRLQSDAEVNVPTFQYLLKIFQEIDLLRSELEKDDKILISVRNQKLLRTCFELIASLGFSPCLIPGLGINLTKRSSMANIISPSKLTDGQKYDILVTCTDFFIRCYKVPVLKTIITTFHLSDYLAALIQLSFAPLKKPGSYTNFTMTSEMYNALLLDRNKYVDVYESLVTNCFQPILMKELLALQSVTHPNPPGFVKRVISKEMSRRLLASGGLLSLIRCFIESYAIDSGFDWKKIDMICKLVCVQHGSDSLESYLTNVSSQLMQILTSNNTYYLTTAVACILSLNEKYPHYDAVKSLMSEIFQSLDYEKLSESKLPGTIVLSPEEVEHYINVLHACVCYAKLDWPLSLVAPSLYIILLLGAKCTRNNDMKTKIDDTLLKSLEKLEKTSVQEIMKDFLFGKDASQPPAVVIEEYDAGLAIKCLSSSEKHPKQESMYYFIQLFMKSSTEKFVQNVFEASLMFVIDLSEIRKKKADSEDIIKEEGNEIILGDINENYANILKFLSEITATSKVINALKSDPTIVLNFLEHFLLKTQANPNEECVTIALVLLNTILSNLKKTEDLERTLDKLTPVLRKLAANEYDLNSILCKEALSHISSEAPRRPESKCERAISDVFDELLPVRAHGIIELTKLIDAGDPEAVSKKHYIFCLLQEQLKDGDSYIYLSAINGIASLGTHCTEDVLQVLCKEFLGDCTGCRDIKVSEEQNKIMDLRMKIGDIIVKVTKRLGEMAIVHKTILLNTMLCGCRDEDPFIRTSALSNLAEIALVLHYKIGSIIYEVLHCIWSILETDKAVECRRAAVMVITSLLKGMGKQTIVQLQENLLPIYRALKKLYRDAGEDSAVRLHAQLALEQLNEAVNEFLFPELQLEKQIFVLVKPEHTFK